MEVQFGPNSVEEPNLLYKLQRKLKVFNTSDTLPNHGYNLVTSSSKYGLVLVATPNGTLSVYYLKQLIDKESEAPHVTVKLSEKPSHIAISCDQELLGVTGGQLFCVYKVSNFQNQNASPSATIKLDPNPSTFVSSLQWNPCIPDSVAIAFYDGTLLACQVSTSQIKKVQSKCRCLCWSPKGKQFVTGNSDGTLTQYKPDLTPAKTVPAPNLFESAPVETLAIYWISTYQFAVVYKKATDDSRPAVTIINTPKAGQPSCLNYEDICYSMGSNRPWYYYLQGLAQWNIILASSSNSMEIATLGSTDGASWLQWCQMDEARPELPLTDKKQENYPVGICIDTCAIHQLPWGENDTLPHMPLLLVVSQTGFLTIFNIINLNKQASQLCSPPQQVTLPAAVMTTEIPDNAQPVQTAPASAPQPVISIPKPVAASQPFQPAPAPQVVQSVPSPTPQFGAPSLATSKPLTFETHPPQTPQVEQKQPTEVKPASQPQPQPTTPTVQKQSTPPSQPTPQMQEAYAAMKAEQDRIKAAKANQELKSMLIKEVNDFQMELYKFMVKTKQTQQKLQQDIEALNTNLSLPVADAEELKKECSLEDLRCAIVQLKLELVRMCAVVAEAKTHAEAKDLQQWTQADPLTTKRVASVKKVAYYVHNQVEQAQKALEHKWNEYAAKDPKSYKPGQYMIRPILDDVYQPLVKQQEILSRQQAVLRTLKNTLKEVDATPMFKSTSLLRSTPFRNKDPLSKLTKNIFNMSIEPQNKQKDHILSAQKLDALRDMLSNHKTVKVKPVNVELTQQLAAMRLNYEKSLKNRAAQESQQIRLEAEKIKVEAQQVKIEARPIKFEAQQKIQQPPLEYVQPTPKVVQPAPVLKIEPKPDIIEQMPVNVPSFTPVANTMKPSTSVPGLTHVARTLFTDEPKKQEPAKDIQPKQPQPTLSKPVVSNQAIQPQPFAVPTPSSPVNTRSVLKDLLQNKQACAAAIAAANAANAANAKSDANTFMGQKICSPSAFAFSVSNASTPVTTASFTAKPISDINNMFSKFQTSSFALEPKPTVTPSQKSSETGEPDVSVSSEPKKDDKPFSSTFGTKAFMPLTANKQPAVTKTQEVPKIEAKAPVKVILKAAEKSKENVPEKSSENIPQESQKPINKKEPEVKPLEVQITAASVFGTASNVFGTTSSVFGTTSSVSTATQSVVSSANSTISSEPQKPAEVNEEVKPETPVETSVKPDITVASSASSIFAAANASTTVSKEQSVFSSTAASTTQTGSIFGTAQSSATTTPTESSDKPSLFGTNAVSSASSIFGAAVASQEKTTPSGSLFGTPSSPTSSVFGSSTTGSVFGTAATTTAGSLFGTTTTASVFSSEAKPSLFSSTSTTPSSVFGATTTQSIFASSPSSVFANASQPSVFASAATGSIFGTATTQASVFGTSTAPTNVFGTATTQPSVFGSPTTTASSIFGAATTQASVFGTTATTAQSVFGTSTATTQSSVFGTATSQPSVFGAPASPGSIFGSPTQASVFGTPTQTTQASVFGTPTQTTQASVFGTPTQTTQASVFGTPTQTTQASVFGTPTQTTQASVFGTPPATTAQSGSLFGGAESNMFAAASISTTSAPAQSSGGSIFGSSSGSVFGNADGSTNVFGGKSSFTQSNPSAAAIFGGGASFGQKPANNFWSGGSTTGSTGFGSGFGQQSTQASSIFGASSGGSFSTPAPSAQPFGSAQPTAFGSPQQQSAGAFGGSPVFASKPVFGQSSGFGSPPAASGFGSFGGFNKSPTSGFGAPATFGGGASFGGTAFGGTSPSKLFGGTSPGFGSPTQSNATFENLATQNTLTFGNLAQQSGQQPQAAPSFNTSPAFTGWRG